MTSVETTFQRSTVPAEILLPFEFADMHLLEESLLQLGHRTQFLLPQRGAKRHDWRDCVAEHMVRAVTQRILRLRRGAAPMRTLACRDKQEGYIFQDRLAQALAIYEASRGLYPTLLDFFPEWLKVLKEWR